MTTFNYSRTALTSARLLVRFGAPCTLRRQSGTAYDPNTSTNVPTYTDTAATAAVFAYPQGYVNGTDILQGDQRALMPPAIAPVQGDRLAWQGKEYAVISVKPVAPAGVAVLYEAQLRG